MDFLALACLFFGSSAVVVTVRFTYVLMRIRQCRKVPFDNVSASKEIRTMVVVGSGGHTTEMMQLVGALGRAYRPRHYIVADTDIMSTVKIDKMEIGRQIRDRQYVIMSIPRSREVAQSWLTSVFTTIRASLAAFPLVIIHLPDLILVNGPGTCIPVCVAGFLLTVLGMHRVRVVYVESMCRVTTMSLSGRILYYMADQVFVQWPQLQQKYPLTQYIGRLV